MTKAGPDLFVFKQRGLHRAADLGGPWVACGAVPRPPGSYGELIDAGETLFYFVMDVGLFRSRAACGRVISWLCWACAAPRTAVVLGGGGGSSNGRSHG
jgi:hypothetical protein